MTELKDDFHQAVRATEGLFGLELADTTVAALEHYYSCVLADNELLHLVAPHSTGEFVTRHILESLALLEFLPEGSSLADIGAGAGLPSIPCLLARSDLRGTLIESKLKKSDFLIKTIEDLSIGDRATVINRQFEEIPKPAVGFVTCRALDKFIQKLPKLLKWSAGSGLLLFGGPSLREALTANKVRFTEKLMPLSEQRYLFVCQPFAPSVGPLRR